MASKRLFNADFLDQKRLKTDQLSDAAVFALLDEKIGFFDLLSEIRQRASKNPNSVFANFINKISTVPPWVDQKKMNLGREFFCQNAFLASSVLYCCSLIESYLNARGSKVLMFTGRLHLEARRRIFETGKMVADIVSTNSLAVDSAEFDTVIRVRILHSVVRYNIIKSSKWNYEYGHPVNQEDMAITLIMFSSVVLRGLKKLGLKPSAQQESGYQLLWRYVGYLLGLDEDLLCLSVAEEQQLYSAIAQRQFFPDEDSRLLSHSLLKSVSNNPPAFLPEEAIFELSRFYIGNDFADQLQFPRNLFWRLFFENLKIPLSGFQFLGSFLPFAGDLSYKAGRSFIENTLQKELAEAPADFRYKKAQ